MCTVSNEAIIEYPTITKLRCYTTLCNIKVRKANNNRQQRTKDTTDHNCSEWSVRRYTVLDLSYARKQLLLSARLSNRNSVCPSVHPSVCHTSKSVKNDASQDHQIFTVGCLEDSSFRNHEAFP